MKLFPNSNPIQQICILAKNVNQLHINRNITYYGIKSSRRHIVLLNSKFKNIKHLHVELLCSIPELILIFILTTHRHKFNEGETSIAKNAACSLLYAYWILESRFELGEEAVSKHPLLSVLYAQHILKDRFPLGESTISNNAYASLMYVRCVLRDRFPEAEKVLMQFSADSYKEFLESIGKPL